MDGYLFYCLVFLLASCKDVGSSPSPGEYLDTDYSNYYPCKYFDCKNGGYCETKGAGNAYCVCPSGYTGSKCQYRTGPTLSIENIRCNNSCATATSCRICQSCDSCGFEPQCLTYEALINGGSTVDINKMVIKARKAVVKSKYLTIFPDLDTECHAQGFEEAILIKTTQSPIGYTKRRCGQYGVTYDCPAGSVCVEDGKGGGVCCRSKVGIDYIRNKPGSCPPSLDAQFCGRHSCQGDIDCAGNLKCCQQCGNKCTNPYRDPCQNVRCNNGGRCTVRGLQASCECSQGYLGQYCDIIQRPTLSIENIRCNNSCATATSCRICQSCDSCGFEPLCLTYEALINDLDTECHAQGFQEAILIKTTQSPIGYTKLRCGNQGVTYNCPSGSMCVEDGKGGGVCCRSRVGLEYIRNKPGSCPTNLDAQFCGRQSCRGDIDCAGNLKCCQQCGNKCTNPYTDPCQNVRCNNGGRCTVSGLQASCECSQGYLGQYCEIIQRPTLSIENIRCNNSCATATSCRICQSCDSCGFEPLCLTYEALINDLDIECHAQGFQEAILIKTTQSPIGYTKLRCGNQGVTYNCPSGSVCVEDGKGGGVCCRSRVGLEYIRNKPGSCPTNLDAQFCGRQSCRGDIDCAGNLKCCQQCGNKCTNPYTDPCQNVRCNNGGSCTIRGLQASCECSQGYLGQYCDTRQDPCSNVRCLNGGRCLSRGLVPYCECSQGYIGQYCDVIQDPCSNVRCLNGGRCLSRGLVPYCECPQSYIGQYCNVRQDPCLNVKCNNGGRCLSRGLEPYCECPQGYIGSYCEALQDPCQNFMCNNGGRCVASGTQAYCTCISGYSGRICETKPDPCYNYRCENDGRCIAIGDRPYCQCLQDYTGYRCEARIDTRAYPYWSCNSTCSQKTSCRVCLTCQTCQAETICLENYKLVKDLDRECQACGYVEALLIKNIQSPVGYIPLTCQGSSNCPVGSACVEDGKGSGTCCRTKVGPNYLDNKPGSCPAATGLPCAGAGCQRDSDCAGNLKCCRNCGNQCTNPVLPLSDVCGSCPRGTVCATVDRCLSGSGACLEQARPRCVIDACGTCFPGEKCKVVFDDRFCTAGQDCDNYIYKCVPVQATTCRINCEVGAVCTAVGKCCLIQDNRNDKYCDNLYRCQNVNIRQCSQCRDGLYCRDTLVNCVGSNCPQSYECIDPCGGCPSGKICRLNGLQGLNRYECVSQLPCGGCSTGLVCKDVQTVCNGAYCVKQQCVAPKDDKCGGCPHGLSCHYISTGCPTPQCSPPTYRCVSGTVVEGQCPYVPPSYSLETFQCRGQISARQCRSDSDCQSDNDKCCPDSCGTKVCKRCYWLK